MIRISPTARAEEPLMEFQRGTLCARRLLVADSFGTPNSSLPADFDSVGISRNGFEIFFLDTSFRDFQNTLI